MSKKLIKAGNAIVEQVIGYAEVDQQLRDAINAWVKLVKSPTKPSGRKPTPEAVPLAEYLLQRVSESSTATLLTNVQASAGEIAKILRAGATADDVRDTIDWLFDVNAYCEYPFRVESGGSLRRKWNPIQIARSRQNQKAKVKQGGYF